MEKLQVPMEEISVELLSQTNKHLIAGFCSTACKELECFLKENAWHEQELGFSKTYLF